MHGDTKTMIKSDLIRHTHWPYDSLFSTHPDENLSDYSLFYQEFIWQINSEITFF